MESLISLIVAVEVHFEEYAVPYIPHLIECMQSSEWSTRKCAIDVVYTLSALLPDVLIPFKHELVESLNNLRFDKFKQVWESCIEAFQAIKTIGGNDDSSKSPNKLNEARV